MEHFGYNNYDICYLARILLEAETPLKIGSGSGNTLTDTTVIRDVNGLPVIPGTTLQGILRHALRDDVLANRMMGWQTGTDGRGSFLTISEAKLVDNYGRPVDGLRDIKAEIEKNEFLNRFANMPIRQHVRLSDKGTAVNKAKYDEEVVVRGTRFCFEIQLDADNANGEHDFAIFLSHLNDNTFRIGGGSRKGFGKIKVVDVEYCKLELNNPMDFKAYMEKTSCISAPWDRYQHWTLKTYTDQSFTHYELKLKPKDFILFSSGFGNENSDMAVVREPYIDWTSDGKGKWVEQKHTLVVPASSVKGAIAHRTAFYYNLFCEDFADENRKRATTGKDNPAVRSLFGYADDSDSKDKQRGRVLFSDIVRTSKSVAKIINHVKIDRFTGGAINGALFDEEPLFAEEDSIVLEVDVIEGHQDDNINKAFERALHDICDGLLPLGGGTNRGNGRFIGTLFKNGEECKE